MARKFSRIRHRTHELFRTVLSVERESSTQPPSIEFTSTVSMVVAQEGLNMHHIPSFTVINVLYCHHFRNHKVSNLSVY